MTAAIKHAVPTAAVLLALASWPAAPRADDADWAERVDLSGDFRLRYESIDRAGLPEQSRSRYRVRLNAGVDLYDDVRFVVSLATAADNPVSRNVTFGGNALDDDFGVDLAYVEWQPRPDLDVFAGKMKNPMYAPGRDQLVYDNDLNPGGVAAAWAPGNWFVNAGVFAVEQRSLTADTLLYHVQGGGDWRFADVTLKAGAGYLVYTNTVGNTPFVFDLPAGNTVDAMNRYVYEYANVEAFAEFGAALGGLPLSAFAHYTENVEVSGEDAGLAVGLTLGEAQDAGSWEAGWTWKRVEADAVVGSFTESDFGGGGTDVEGHVLGGSYLLRDRLALEATLFLNEAITFRDDARDYRRLQLDLQFEFD